MRSTLVIRDPISDSQSLGPHFVPHFTYNCLMPVKSLHRMIASVKGSSLVLVTILMPCYT